MATFCFWFLIIVCLAQFMLIANLMIKLSHKISDYKDLVAVTKQERSTWIEKSQIKPVELSKALTSVDPKVYGGVAATLLLHAPSWFQRRYTMMIQNVIANIPDDWVVQIFYTAQGQSKKGIDINPGIQRYVNSGKVILTVIPTEVLSIKKKRYELMLEPWIWENMLAENILIFGGNAVICSNSPYKFTDFLEFDYIGSPWNSYKGAGGDGTISLRKKSTMVNILNYALQKVPLEQRDTAYKTWGQDDHFFVSSIIEIMKLKEGKGQKNKKGKRGNAQESELAVPMDFRTDFKIATRNDTLRYSAIGGAYNNEVLVVSGTLPAVKFDDRNKFINVCPEIKMFYPSLHDPNCFGAQPDGAKCAVTICALKNRTERRGGC